MKYLFLDTNIFIHFEYIGSIDWKKVINDDIEIIICIPVISELDKKKRDNDRKISKKAREFLSKLDKIRDKDINLPFKLDIYLSRNMEEIYTNNSLDRNEGDDKILASILKYKEDFPKRDVLLITDDSGPRYKAESLGIKATPLPETYRLKPTQNSYEKKIGELQEEIDNLKGDLPDIKFSFVNDKSKIEYNIKKLYLNYNEFMQEKMDEVSEIIKAKTGVQSMMQTLMQSIKIEQFEQNSRTYYNDCFDFYRLESLSYKFDFLLKNIGTTPSSNVELNLFFPKKVQVKFIDEYPELPTGKPDFEYSQYDIGRILNKGNGLIIDDKESFKPEIKSNENGTEVRFSYKSFMHESKKNIDSLFIQFYREEEVKSFNVEYTLIMTEIPKPTKGFLHFIFKQ